MYLSVTDGDGLLLESLFGIIDELLGEHGQDIREGFDKGDVEVVLDLRQPLLQIRVEEVLELSGEFDTCWPAAYNDHVQQALLLVIRLVLEGGRLTAVHDAGTDALSVSDLLQEQAVLAHAGNAWGLVSYAKPHGLAHDAPKVAFSAPTPTTSMSKGTSVCEDSPLISESSLM
jgi:hypothetical protein